MTSLSLPAATRPQHALVRLAPGVFLCVAIAAAAWAAEGLEVRWLGRAWLEALVLAILVGAAVRAVWTPSRRFEAGMTFSAKTVLEIAIVLLGATVSGAAILGVGPALLAGIPFVVGLAILLGYGLGRLLGLQRRLALLVACGNAICGNSAIAAVAPVIGADGDDVAASIAFTAVLGVLVVLGLPLVALGLRLTPHGFGVLAGLTVYAVPQVLAATAPVSSISAQVGAVVKLVRVLLLGPVLLAVSLVTAGRGRRARVQAPLGQLVPWFIVAFLALVAARSAGLVPAGLVRDAGAAASRLTVVAMAALGLAVDLPAMARVGPRVIAAASLSLAALGALAFGLMRLTGLA